MRKNSGALDDSSGSQVSRYARHIESIYRRTNFLLVTNVINFVFPICHPSEFDRFEHVAPPAKSERKGAISEMGCDAEMRNHYVSEISHQKGYIDSPPSFFVAPPCSYFHEASEFYCSVSFAAAASNVPFYVVCNFHRVKHDPILQNYFHRFSLPCRSDIRLTEAVVSAPIGVDVQGE